MIDELQLWGGIRCYDDLGTIARVSYWLEGAGPGRATNITLTFLVPKGNVTVVGNGDMVQTKTVTVIWGPEDFPNGLSPGQRAFGNATVVLRQGCQATEGHERGIILLTAQPENGRATSRSIEWSCTWSGRECDSSLQQMPQDDT